MFFHNRCLLVLSVFENALSCSTMLSSLIKSSRAENRIQIRKIIIQCNQTLSLLLEVHTHIFFKKKYRPGQPNWEF